VSLSSVFFSYSPQNHIKIQIGPYTSTLLSLAPSFIICIVEFVCFRVICCWSHCVFSHHPSFFLVFLLRLHQTLARRNHLPCFSPSVTSNPSAPQPSSLFLSFGYIKPSQCHKPSQRRFLIFLLRLRKKTEKNKPSQRRFLVFLLRLRKKKQKQKKENEGERIQSGCLISVVFARFFK
jgi:hypothetical protein